MIEGAVWPIPLDRDLAIRRFLVRHADWNVGVDEAEEDGGSPSVDWRGNEQVETEPTEGTTSTDSPDRLYEHASVAPTTCSVASQLPLRR